jgi:outer membrane receptor protein involved in Fe transport
MISKRRIFLITAVALLVSSWTLFAQGTTGMLTGTVRNDGVPLPGATVTISSPGLQGVRTAVTDVNGNYNIGGLPPGDYTVKIELAGMSTATRTARVGLTQTARADADLKISGVNETITVTAASPVTAALESTEVQTNVQQKTVNDLPMRRDMQNIGNLAPGVTTNGPSLQQLVIAGAPASENLLLVNGAVVNENVRSQIQTLFIEDAIQETTVQTAGISAEFGRFSGGVVSTITKSGGNEFSGSLRDSLENDAWSAKSAYEAQPDRLDDMREVYEGTLGGRIIRDRLWFFLAGRYFQTNTQQVLAPTETDTQSIPYTRGQENKRYEVKLTGQLTAKHSLQGAYLTNDTIDSNFCFGGTGTCYNIENIDASRSLPNDIKTAHYNGVLTSNLLLEAGYSQKGFAFEGSGGDFADPVHGSWGYDLSTGAFFGAPVFCGFCDPEVRNNRDYQLKSTYYAATRALGTHNLVVGYDDFTETRKANNYQSGSNFELYVNNSPKRAADGTLLVTIDPAAGDYIQHTPILEQSRGSSLGTKSLFANNKWDLNSRLSFNLGLRYDKNDVKDSGGNKIADDSRISPRLGVTFDPGGNGRVRVNANYGTYVSHIQETVGGSGASGAGNPAYIDWAYAGPAIIDVPMQQAFEQVFQWFESVGGVNNTEFLFSSGYPGINTVIRDGLSSPSVDEWTLGAGLQVGGKGYLRGDYIDREWHDFYGIFSTKTTVTDPGGNISDLNEIRNTDAIRRDYHAALLQANYRVSDHFNVGGNYTWSETQGNFRGETAGNGPISDTSTQYPEWKAFAQNNPYGPLDAVDQTHKARLFATYDLPTPVGSFTLGLLERFDSGTPYSAVGSIPTPVKFADPSLADVYIGRPGANVVSYYFGGRGDYRWDNVTATDLSVTYTLPISKANFWVKGDVINALDEQAQINGNTTIRTSRNTGSLAEFNPFTSRLSDLVECPQGAASSECASMGAHWQKGSAFGQARNNNDYQLPRTIRLAVGMRF